MLHDALSRFRTPKHATYRFMWVEAGSSIAEQLNIPVPADTIPRLVALEPYRQKIAFFPSDEDLEDGHDLDEPGEILDWLMAFDLPLPAHDPAWRAPARDPDELWERIEESKGAACDAKT